MRHERGAAQRSQTLLRMCELITNEEEEEGAQGNGEERWASSPVPPAPGDIGGSPTTALSTSATDAAAAPQSHGATVPHRQGCLQIVYRLTCCVC